MKKVLSTLLLLCALFTLAACGQKPAPAPNVQGDEAAQSSAAPSAQASGNAQTPRPNPDAPTYQLSVADGGARKPLVRFSASNTQPQYDLADGKV